MDHKLSKPDGDSWVDDRMAKLAPVREWTPDADLAFDRLARRKPALNAPWMRLAMTSTILAATALVLVMLPWGRLWTPKSVTTVAAQAQSAPQEEKATQTVETLKTTPAPAPTEPQGKAVPDLPDFEKKPAESPVPAQVQAASPEETSPVLIRSALPEYSEEAKREKITGTVILKVTVRTDGTVQFESFQQTIGHGLDEKAREAVEKWQFTPAMKDGVPVAKMIDITVNFSLR